ncbi:MAG: type II toxin-antitoxin system VapC family toxin [Gammaproteobacteria bacterium]
MIILDTNVVSEPMRRNGDPAVLEWLDRQASESLYLTATSFAKLLLGVEILPQGNRKKGLAAALAKLITELFGSRILPFDEPAAKLYASLVSGARSAGRVVGVANGQIAAIAAAHDFAVATRDALPFQAVGVPVINPWEE